MIPGVVVTAGGGLAFDPELAVEAHTFIASATENFVQWLARVAYEETLNGYFG